MGQGSGKVPEDISPLYGGFVNVIRPSVFVNWQLLQFIDVRLLSSHRDNEISTVSL